MRFWVAFGLAALFSAFGGSSARATEPLPTLRGVIAEPAAPTPMPMVLKLGRFAGSPNCGMACAEFIYAAGEIRPDTVEALLILQSRLNRALPIYLNSPGGNLDGGLALGRMIRQAGMDTQIGALRPLDCRRDRSICSEADQRAGLTVFSQTIEAAPCNSACVYAFAGGVRRTVLAGSSIGVHRYFLTRTDDPLRRPLAKLTHNDHAKLQRTDGVLAEYLNEMGVRSELLTISAAVDPQNLRGLSSSEMTELNVVTPGFAPVPRAPTPVLMTGSVAKSSTEPMPASWPILHREGRPFLVLSVPAESRRYGAITSELAIGCPVDPNTYNLSFRELIQSRTTALARARIWVDPDEQHRHRASDPAQQGIAKSAALKADQSGTLVVEVISDATAGYPARLEFPSRGLSDSLGRLERACGL